MAVMDHFESVAYQSVKEADEFSFGGKNLKDVSQKESLGTGLFSTLFGPNHIRHTESFRSRRLYLMITIVNIVVLLASMMILVFSYSYVKSIETNSENRLVRLTSTYSSIFDQLHVELTTRKTDGSFWPQKPASIYQLPPSPEADAAWSRLSDTHAIALTAAQVRKLGKNPTDTWPFPSSYKIPGHPENHQYETYMGLPNVFHQIHCLDIFRRLAHPQYYGEFWTHSFKFPFQEHVGHCQYLLLQTLMCHADLEIVTFNKVKGTAGPFPEFSVDQKCRDFENILMWKEANQVNVTDEEWKEIQVTPEGIRDLEPEGRTMPFL